jgi:hypothetical protein
MKKSRKIILLRIDDAIVKIIDAYIVKINQSSDIKFSRNKVLEILIKTGIKSIEEKVC